MLLRGACYPSFGKPDDGLGFGPEMMPHDHGSTGIAGIAYYAADQFPPSVPGHALHRQRGDQPDQSRPDRVDTARRPKAIEQPDFVWQRRSLVPARGPQARSRRGLVRGRLLQPDHRPLRGPARRTPAATASAAGSGGSSIEGRGGQRAAPPATDRTKATVGELVEDLGTPNLAVRHRGGRQLVDRGGRAGVEAVRRRCGGGSLPASGSTASGCSAAWLRSTTRGSSRPRSDGDRELRVHALRVLAEKPAWSGPHRELALRGLRNVDPFVRRAAAEAMVQHPDPVADPPAARPPPLDDRSRGRRS